LPILPAGKAIVQSREDKIIADYRDVVIVTIEADRVILEKHRSSPVDASFGLWARLPPGPEYVDTLRDEWNERLTER
jgi:hypothetical protein